MAIEALAPRFGRVPVVLVAQEDDGSPCYCGDMELIRLPDDMPLDRLPWKRYSAG